MPGKSKKKIPSYRLVLIDDNNRRSKMSAKLGIFNILVFLSLFLLFSAGMAWLMQSYYQQQRSKEEVPLTESQTQWLETWERIEELEKKLTYNEIYTEHLLKVISGEIKAEHTDSLMAKAVAIDLENLQLRGSKQDSLLRVQVAQEELEALKRTPADRETSGGFFTPLRGVKTAGFSLADQHPAIDIAATTGDPVKSIADGTILFSSFTPDTGYTLLIQHPNNVVSVYKHCSRVLRRTGQTVKKGEVIAHVGNTGELTTGPHLHFELWRNGIAQDPENYIQFK
ncbi:MAG: M23 family metallopeptidase [Weeksellaceae bacterium]|nr:M23 family metallopeptidase [Weeksellaceae bacterium]